MPEVYTLRAPENFNYNNDHHPLLPRVMNSSPRKPEIYYLKSNDDKQTPSYNLLKPPPSRVSANAKRKSPVSYQPLHKQKPEMYHFTTGGKKPPSHSRQLPSPNNIPEKPKLNGIPTHPATPSQKKATTYMITASKEDNFLPYIPHTPSPPMQPNKEKQVVSFNTINHDDKYDIINKNKQRYFSTEIRYVPLSKSKATECIQRSMNRYRFRRN